MGAPTSPVLSNIVFAPTDLLLWQLAEKRNWTYSRYADDLSFSSESQIDWNDYAVIEKILSHAGFPLNQTKSKLFQPQDNKMITGLLVLPNKIEIPTDFIPNLVKDIQLMAGAFTVQFRMSIKSSMINERFRKMVAGKIQFAARIMGIHHPAIQKIRQKYLVAIRPPSQPLYWEEVDFEYY
jgi:RNA-directed DNA polymerase